MIYADTDFFLALLKPKDWLKEGQRSSWKNIRERLRHP